MSVTRRLQDDFRYSVEKSWSLHACNRRANYV